jgi:hypothetical protein
MNKYEIIKRFMPLIENDEINKVLNGIVVDEAEHCGREDPDYRKFLKAFLISVLALIYDEGFFIFNKNNDTDSSKLDHGVIIEDIKKNKLLLKTIQRLIKSECPQDGSMVKMDLFIKTSLALLITNNIISLIGDEKRIENIVLNEIGESSKSYLLKGFEVKINKIFSVDIFNDCSDINIYVSMYGQFVEKFDFEIKGAKREIKLADNESQKTLAKSMLDILYVVREKKLDKIKKLFIKKFEEPIDNHLHNKAIGCFGVLLFLFFLSPFFYS